MYRRNFLQSVLAGSLAALPALATQSPLAASDTNSRKPNARKPRVLLRNGWQSQNIGDIAHYIGMCELLAVHGVEADVRFWTSNMENGADALFKKTFPQVPFFSDRRNIDKAFEECDFLLHGSSSGFGAYRQVRDWITKTGKPFGVMGISLTETSDELIEVLNQADFVYFRDGVSAKRAVDEGCTTPVQGWGPDTAFGVVKTRNDEAALAFMQEHGLEAGKFLCCIPRYRWTPFWTLNPNRPFSEERHARNEEMKDHDHAPHREAIIALARQTEMKVLITHEDQTQIQLGKEMLYDPLPDDVKQKVVWRDRFWLLDEAVSIYARSAGLFGNEMHSPIMCIANGIPAVVGRWDEQTNKGFMWRDIGLDEWLFTMDDEQRIEQIPATVLEIAKNPAAAKAKAEAARQVVLQRQQQQFATLKKSLHAAVPT